MNVKTPLTSSRSALRELVNGVFTFKNFISDVGSAVDQTVDPTEAKTPTVNMFFSDFGLCHLAQKIERLFFGFNGGSDGVSF